jgi:hypothetical protein
LAPEDRVRKLLGNAGFIDIQLEDYKAPTRMGHGDLEDCLEFVADFSNPVATALRRTDPEISKDVLQSVRAAIAPYHKGDTLELPASAWIVTGKRS